MIEKLVKIADKLDQKKKYAQADLIDETIQLISKSSSEKTKMCERCQGSGTCLDCGGAGFISPESSQEETGRHSFLYDPDAVDHDSSSSTDKELKELWDEEYQKGHPND